MPSSGRADPSTPGRCRELALTPPDATTYTVTARRDQVERWEAAASADGLRSVGSWLAETADTYLLERGQTGRPPALPWLQDRFRVLVTDTTARPEMAHEIEVRGLVSGPFGIFRGDGGGVGEPGCSRYSLVHRPTRRIIATLPLRKSCMALAAELAVLYFSDVKVGRRDPPGRCPGRCAVNRIRRHAALLAQPDQRGRQ